MDTYYDTTPINGLAGPLQRINIDLARTQPADIQRHPFLCNAIATVVFVGKEKKTYNLRRSVTNVIVSLWSSEFRIQCSSTASYNDH